MSSIDNRIVNMQFNNKGFESGISSTLSSLKKLDEKLKMKSSAEGVNKVSDSLKSLSNSGISGLAAGVESISSKFSALGVIGVTALANITNKAVNAGSTIAKALTIDPVMTGFSEYETKMNAIQTILTNTAHQGTTLGDVNKSLNELNTYADKTIYNFAQMTENIGKFTAAGVDLETSVASIKGIANLAAASGSTPQQASTAMYQLSQALAAGKVSLMDWNSVVNAGMGGKLFQDALIRTSENLGTGADNMIKKYGSFRESLTKGEWLTTEVLTETLKQLSGAYTEADLIAQGYTKSQAKQIMELAKNATAAATEVKTVTQLFDTMKESVQSGWAQSWEHIIGDKEQATKLLSGISEAFNNIIQPSTDARNKMLEFWNKAGGRDDVIKGMTNIFGSLGKGLGSIGDAFKEVFPPMTGERLVEISKGFKDLTEKFKMSDSTADKIKSTFKGVFSVLDFGKTAVVSLLKAFTPMTGVFSGIGNVILTVTSGIGKFFTGLSNSAKSSKVFESFVTGVQNGIKSIGNFLGDAASGIEKLFSALGKVNFAPVFDFIGEIGKGLGGGIESVFGGMGKALGNINFNTIFGSIAALAAGSGLKTIKSIGETLSDTFNAILKVPKNVSGLLDSCRKSLEAYQKNLNAGTLLKLAAAIGILSASLVVLSTIDAEDMETALTGITILFIELVAGMTGLLKIAAGTSLKGFFSLSTGLLAMSVGILVLSAAMKNLSGLDWGEVAVGLTSVVGLMATLVAASKLMSTSGKGMISTAIGLTIFAGAINILANAVKMLGQLDIGTVTQGLISVGVLLAELALFMKVTDLNSMGIKNSIGILIMAVALQALASAVDEFGSLNTGQLIQGLVGVAAVLAEMSLFMRATGNVGKVMAVSVGMIALATAMNILASAVTSFGKMKWDAIGRGLIAMAGSLAILGVAVALIPGGSLIATGVGIGVMSASLLLLSSALNSMGSMSWEQVAVSLVTLAGSLTILAVAMASMTMGLAGAAAMLVMSAALMLFVPQLLALSQLNLSQVGIGLLALGGAFAVLGLAGLILAPLIPALIGLSGAIALLGVGCMAAGVGVSLFATGLATLAAVGVAGGLGLAEVFRQLINLIPLLGQKLAEGAVAWVTSIAEATPQLIEAAGQIITGFLTAFSNALPQIADAGLQFISTLCQVLGEAIPQLITLGVDLLLALLEGIASSIGQIATVATEIIVGFINAIASNLGSIIEAGVNLAISFIEGLASAIESNSERFDTAVESLITACVNSVTGTAISVFKGLGNSAIGGLVSGAVSKIGSFISTVASGVSRAATSAASKVGQFLSAGGRLISGLISGISSKIGQIASTVGRGVSNAVNAAKRYVGSMVSAGGQVISGFIRGIKSKASEIARAASNVVKNAINAAKNALGIHSPSRVFAEIGRYTAEGMVVGMNDNAEKVGASGENLARTAIDNANVVLSKLSSMMSSDMDYNPVITPVLDLSSVEDGTKTISNMLASQDAVTLKTSLTGAMTRNISGVQNGKDNTEIVSALGDLKKAMSKVNSTTYQVNGVTYDDGSNVSSAVEALIHAANIERRI